MKPIEDALKLIIPLFRHESLACNAFVIYFEVSFFMHVFYPLCLILEQPIPMISSGH